MFIYMHCLYVVPRSYARSGPARSNVSDWEGNLAGSINCNGVCPFGFWRNFIWNELEDEFRP